MTEQYADVDWFTDSSVVEDPYPYFEALRAEGPLRREAYHDVVMVTGYEEDRKSVV